MQKTRLVNLPNVLTILRIMLCPAFVGVYFALPSRRDLALGTYLATALTDVLDGLLARRLGQITWLGKLLDPLADKLMALSMLTCLCASGEIAPWVALAFLLREGYMVAGAALLFRRGCVVKSDVFGKVATICFVAATSLILPWHGQKAVAQAGRILLYISLAAALLAAAHYTWQSLKLRAALAPRPGGNAAKKPAAPKTN